MKNIDYYSSKRRNEIVQKTTVYLFLTINAILVLMPLVFLILTSFKTMSETLGAFEWFPKQLYLDNFKDVMNMENFFYLRFFSNTILIFALKFLGTVVTCSLTAYGFVKFSFKYKALLFGVLLTVLMLPGELLTIPIYETYINLGWYDTYYPFFVACFFGTDVFCIFLFRQFFLSLPSELFEAAKIDGASEIKIYSRIVMPLSIPVIVTTAILYFTGTYNDIYTPMLYLSSEENFTIAQGIRLIESLFNTGSHDYIIPWNLVSAATILGILPVLIIFFIAQKYFIEGVASTGIKG